MHEITKCETCKHCTNQNKESGRGLCTEQHQPSNAKGEHKGTVYLQRMGCRYFESSESAKLLMELDEIENDTSKTISIKKGSINTVEVYTDEIPPTNVYEPKKDPMKLPTFPVKEESARSKKKHTYH